MFCSLLIEYETWRLVVLFPLFNYRLCTLILSVGDILYHPRLARYPGNVTRGGWCSVGAPSADGQSSTTTGRVFGARGEPEHDPGRPRAGDSVRQLCCEDVKLGGWGEGWER